jgi:hypothetical protein
MASDCCLKYPSEETPAPTYLDWDPIQYEVTKARRSSTHVTMGGGRVHQDFGASDADRQINLRTDYMEAATLASFREKFAVVGQVWTWTDHEGDAYSVFFRELKATHLQGQEAFEVEMTFDVIGGPA